MTDYVYHILAFRRLIDPLLFERKVIVLRFDLLTTFEARQSCNEQAFGMYISRGVVVFVCHEIDLAWVREDLSWCRSICDEMRQSAISSSSASSEPSCLQKANSPVQSC